MSASGLTLSVDQWATRIRKSMAGTVEAIVAVGVDLHAAKSQLGHGKFGALVASVGMSAKTAQNLMAIANHPVIANANHGAHLPASWRTLYELSRLDEPMLERAIASGDIGPETERAQAIEVRDRYLGKTITATSTHTETRYVPPAPVDEPPANVDPETGEIAPTEPAVDSSPTGSDDGAEDETGQGKEATSEPVSSAPDVCPTCGQIVARSAA